MPSKDTDNPLKGMEKYLHILSKAGSYEQLRDMSMRSGVYADPETLDEDKVQDARNILSQFSRMQVKPARGPELEVEVAARLFAHVAASLSLRYRLIPVPPRPRAFFRSIVHSSLDF